MSDHGTALTNVRTKRWRVGLNGTAFMGMYLVHPNGHCGPELNLGDSTHGYVTHEDAKALEAEIERLTAEYAELEDRYCKEGIVKNEVVARSGTEIERLTAIIDKTLLYCAENKKIVDELLPPDGPLNGALYRLRHCILAWCALEPESHL